MLSADLRKLLIAQIGNELAAHSLYLAIAIYFERQSLDRWGKLFREQSVEEAQHAQKIIDFLIDNEVGKTRRHIPIRDLVTRAHRALQVLKPVWLMSPTSAAQFVPPAD